MNCQKAGDLLSAYIEGEVAGRECAALEEHLGGCAECHEELETLRSALALLAVPKTLVRPEGLLEEFKAKYLPEAEAATAPRWGFRVPVLPKIEWPSLSRLMLPMGSMAAAGAAAALIVALHGHPGRAVTEPAGVPSTQVASNSVNAASTGTDQNTLPSRADALEKAALAAKPGPITRPPAVRSSEPDRPAGHRDIRVAATPAMRRRHSRVEAGFVARHRSSHRTTHRPRGPLLANIKGMPDVSPVPVGVLKDVERRHREAVRTDDMQWKDWNDQGGAIMHKATAPVAEDGYAEASCKNLTTGKVLRSEAVSIPADPLPAGPAGDESSGIR